MLHSRNQIPPCNAAAMPIKNAQNTPQMPAKLPAIYDDDLAKRCFPHRFRRIGNPYAYLNEIGISPIIEFIYKGHLLIDVAEAVDVPLTALQVWVENEGHTRAIAEAETQSAEGYLAEGMRRLRTAQTEFELRRAKEMIKHAQYMASKKNKAMYGEAVNTKPNSDVTYIFNIPGGTDIPSAIGRVIDSTSNRVAEQTAEVIAPSVSFDMNKVLQQKLHDDLGSHYNIPTINNNVPSPISLGHLEDMEGTEAGVPRLVAPRPLNPTAENPDIGPFYEED